MEEDLICSNSVALFKDEKQYVAFVKTFCKNDICPDYLTWKINTEKRLKNAIRRGEELITFYPQFDLILKWVEEHPFATEEERRAKLMTTIV